MASIMIKKAGEGLVSQAHRNADVGPTSGSSVVYEIQNVPGEVTVDDAKSGAAKPSAADPLAAAAVALTQKHGCVACHGMTAKLVGPGFAEVAKKHAGQADYLAGKIVSGGEGVWGNVPMPAQTLSPDDAKAIASWLAAGAKAP